MRSRKRPRSGGIVACVAEQVPQHRGAAAGRVRALDHLVELLRVADEDDVPRRRPHRERVGERDLPGLVDEEVVERPLVLAREEPRRAGGEVGADARVRVGRRSRPRSRRRRTTPGCRRSPSCGPSNASPSSAAGLDDLVEQVVDRLVARRGDADRLAVRDQVRDQPPRRPRLARAGRALDHEVAAVERAHERLHLVEVGRLNGAVERLAAEDRLERGIAAVAGEQRAAEPLERLLLLVRVVRPAGDQRVAAAARPRSCGPRLSTSRRASRSSSRMLAGDLRGRRIDGLLALRRACAPAAGT